MDDFVNEIYICSIQNAEFSDFRNYNYDIFNHKDATSLIFDLRTMKNFFLWKFPECFPENSKSSSSKNEFCEFPSLKWILHISTCKNK